MRADLSQAKNSVTIVGPWIDSFFVQEVLDSINKDLKLRFIVRIWDDEVDGKTFYALNMAQEKIKNFEARSLPRLHTKAIVIDEKIAYFGSTNWYKYSMEKAVEITVRAKIENIREFNNQISEYWENSKTITFENKSFEKKDSKPINDEIIDPIAKKVLENDPKAFYIGKKKNY